MHSLPTGRNDGFAFGVAKERAGGVTTTSEGHALPSQLSLRSRPLAFSCANSVNIVDALFGIASVQPRCRGCHGGSECCLLPMAQRAICNLRFAPGSLHGGSQWEFYERRHEHTLASCDTLSTCDTLLPRPHAAVKSQQRWADALHQKCALAPPISRLPSRALSVRLQGSMRQKNKSPKGVCNTIQTARLRPDSLIPTHWKVD